MDRRSFLRTASLMAALAHVKIASAKAPPDIEATHVAPTLLMQWTVMASTLALRAWTSPRVKRELLSRPAFLIASVWGEYPRGIRFTVHEDSAQVAHFPLPCLHPKAIDWSYDEILMQLDRELGQDDSFSAFLPTPVIFEAWRDARFRRRLLAGPTTVLKRMGYDLGDRKVVIHANTPTSYHLALPFSPSAFAEVAAMQSRLSMEVSAAGGTTKCCASGTCDICL